MDQIKRLPKMPLWQTHEIVISFFIGIVIGMIVKWMI